MIHKEEEVEKKVVEIGNNIFEPDLDDVPNPSRIIVKKKKKKKLGP